MNELKKTELALNYYRWLLGNFPINIEQCPFHNEMKKKLGLFYYPDFLDKDHKTAIFYIQFKTGDKENALIALYHICEYFQEKYNKLTEPKFEWQWAYKHFNSYGFSISEYFNNESDFIKYLEYIGPSSTVYEYEKIKISKRLTT